MILTLSGHPRFSLKTLFEHNWAKLSRVREHIWAKKQGFCLKYACFQEQNIWAKLSKTFTRNRAHFSKIKWLKNTCYFCSNLLRHSVNFCSILLRKILYKKIQVMCEQKWAKVSRPCEQNWANIENCIFHLIDASDTPSEIPFLKRKFVRRREGTSKRG